MQAEGFLGGLPEVNLCKMLVILCISTGQLPVFFKEPEMF